MGPNANFTIAAALLTIFLLGSATEVLSQDTPTQLQIDFATTAHQRLLEKMRIDENQQTQRLNPRIAAEQLAEATYERILVNRVRLEGNIEYLKTESQRIAGSRDQTSAQSLNNLRNQIAVGMQQFAVLQRQEQSARQDRDSARLARLAAEKELATIQAQHLQIDKELTNLYRAWRSSPQQCNRAAIMQRLTQVATDKDIRSNVTLQTSPAGLTIKYQLVDGGQTYTATRCSNCVINPIIGYYSIWAERDGQVVSDRNAFLLSQVRQSVAIIGR